MTPFMRRRALLVEGAGLNKPFAAPKPPRELQDGEVYANVMGKWSIASVRGNAKDFDQRFVYSSRGMPIEKDGGYDFACGHELTWSI
jgi:hypothetical protein